MELTSDRTFKLLAMNLYEALLFLFFSNTFWVIFFGALKHFKGKFLIRKV